MQFTAEQEKAVHSQDHNLILVAGAGSGKTRVLVERYLTLLDNNPDWKLTDLVAITFTEKAAREMRDRVRIAVQERVLAAGNSAARRRWRNHQSLLDSARIGTIHGLCAQILRSNPAQVPVDPAFEVVDDAEGHMLKQDAVDLALVELAESPAGELLLAYEVRDVRSILIEYAGQLADLPESAEALLASWAEEQERAVREVIDALHEDDNFIFVLEQAPRESADLLGKLAGQWAKVDPFVEDLRGHDPEAIRAGLLSLDGIKTIGGRKNEESVEAKDNLKFLRETARNYLKSYPDPLGEADEEAARLIMLWGQALRVTARHYEALKEERRVLDFDDLERLTRDLLVTYEDVARRYSEVEFRHVMVDEFQDTNPIQREIIYRLCGIEPGVRSAPGRLFVVGDPKQSIYAFRGADVRVFNQVHDEIVAAGGESLPLSRSFRTHERLVKGFNHLFGQIMQEDDADQVDFGSPMSAERGSEAFHRTPVTVLNIAAPEGEKLSSEDRRRWEAYEIARTIQDMRAARVEVWDKDTADYRPFDYGDAALLFRAMTNVGLYETAFKAAGLPYVTVGGKGYFDRQEVWDMIHLIQALRNHGDDLSLAAVLRSPMFGLSDDGLFALRLVRVEKNGKLERASLWDALMQPDSSLPDGDMERADFAREVLAELSGLTGRVTVAELLDTALDLTAYDAILTALPDGDRRRGNIDKLMQKARESGRVSPGDFASYLGDLTALDPREGEATLESSDAIKLMSVHRSKGLEFPFVILPDAGWRRRGGTSATFMLDRDMGPVCKIVGDEETLKPFAYERARALESRREAAESKRLFYVAATRAQDYLMISGGSPANGSWLDQFGGALGLTQPGDYDLPWGRVSVTQPVQRPPDAALFPEIAGETSSWAGLDSYEQIPAQIPPLVAAVEIPPAAPTRHLSATQLEMLGGIPAYRPPAEGMRRFRESVLHDAPPPVRSVTAAARSDARVVGRIVHRALQVLAYRRDAKALAEILRAYAWDEGVSEGEQLDRVMGAAVDMLGRFEEPESLRLADRVLREVPFVVKAGDRVLHGVIDVLYRHEDQWYVLDYKTDDPGRASSEGHAARYYLQVGAYAAAVEARTGETPVVGLYYLRTGDLITVAEATWRGALRSLDDQIGAALLGGG